MRRNVPTGPAHDLTVRASCHGSSSTVQSGAGQCSCAHLKKFKPASSGSAVPTRTASGRGAPPRLLGIPRPDISSAPRSARPVRRTAPGSARRVAPEAVVEPAQPPALKRLALGSPCLANSCMHSKRSAARGRSAYGRQRRRMRSRDGSERTSPRRLRPAAIHAARLTQVGRPAPGLSETTSCWSGEVARDCIGQAAGAGGADRSARHRAQGPNGQAPLPGACRRSRARAADRDRLPRCAARSRAPRIVTAGGRWQSVGVNGACRGGAAAVDDDRFLTDARWTPSARSGIGNLDRPCLRASREGVLPSGG